RLAARGGAVRGAGERALHGEPRRAGRHRPARDLHRHEDLLRRARPAVAPRLPGVRGARRARVPGAEVRPLLLPRPPRDHLDVHHGVGDQHRLGRDTVRPPLSDLSVRPSPRARRLRAPVLVTLAMLLAFESVGGLVIFFARLAFGSTPGETAHVAAGAAAAAVYAWYQWSHLARVWPLRSRLDYWLGVLGAASMIVALGTGLALAAPWWSERIARSRA